MIKLYLLGFLLGFSFVIPGLSAGVLAVTFGIYDKIIYHLVNVKTNFKSSINFLFPILIGSLISFFLYIKLINFFIDDYYTIIIFLFSGFIISGIPNIYKQSLINNKISFSWFFFGNIIIIFSTFFKYSFYINNSIFLSFLFFFALGIILSLTILLPGISGSLILINLGIYIYILNSINELLNLKNIFNNIIILLPMLIGILIGIYFFSKIIYNSLKKYPQKIFSFLLGIIISSFILLMCNVLKLSFNIKEFVIGIILMLITYVLSTKILNNKL